MGFNFPKFLLHLQKVFKSQKNHLTI